MVKQDRILKKDHQKQASNETDLNYVHIDDPSAYIQDKQDLAASIPVGGIDWSNFCESFVESTHASPWSSGAMSVVWKLLEERRTGLGGKRVAMASVAAVERTVRVMATTRIDLRHIVVAMHYLHSFHSFPSLLSLDRCRVEGI